MKFASHRRISDETWAHLEPLIAKVRPKTGRKGLNDRAFVDGVTWMLRSGAPWRDLPPDMAPWQNVYQRFTRWARQGRWSHAYRLLRDGLRLGQQGEVLGSLASTSIRVHQHGAPKKAQAAAQCVGVSRGGKTTKLHVLALAGRKRSLLADRAGLSMGQAHDLHGARFVLNTWRSNLQALAADRAYDAAWLRDELTRRQVLSVIPCRQGQLSPVAHCRMRYRRRNEVERLFGRRRHYRRIATRYDRLAVHFSGFVTTGLLLAGVACLGALT